MMAKKILSISSWAVHGVYAFLCLAMIAMCAISRADILSGQFIIHLSGILLICWTLFTIFPSLPIGFGLHIGLLVTHIVKKQERSKRKIVWTCIRTVLFPTVCIALWLQSSVLLVETTGGV